MDAAIYLSLTTALVLANLPWFGDRLFFFAELPQRRRLIWRLVQWVVYLALASLLMVATERHSIGHNYPQGWEFYASNFFLYVIATFPGFMYRLYKNRS